ncbi:MAG: hypothetical protein MZV63_53250 [Marinilabiliales bacterium]|nr:hypothetical protein [Marinilabiliales bacterium]
MKVLWGRRVLMAPRVTRVIRATREPHWPVLNAITDNQKVPIFSAQWSTSTHATGGNAGYANRAGCVQCHTSQGFLEYVAEGSVAAYIIARKSRARLPAIHVTRSIRPISDRRLGAHQARGTDA